jgi:hypothetical protein
VFPGDSVALDSSLQDITGDWQYDQSLASFVSPFAQLFMKKAHHRRVFSISMSLWS